MYSDCILRTLYRPPWSPFEVGHIMFIFHMWKLRPRDEVSCHGSPELSDTTSKGSQKLYHRFALAVMELLWHTSSCSWCFEYIDESDRSGHCPWLSLRRGGGGSSDKHTSYYNAGLNESVIKRHPVLGGGRMPHLEDGSGRASCRRWHVRWVLNNGEGISRSVREGSR